MNYRLRIALTIIFTSIWASVAFGQESIKLYPLEFSWSHPALQGYKSDECYFIPPVGSDRVFLACSFYQTIHANALRSCLEFGQSSEIPEEKCIPSGLWVGQLNATRTGFEKEWFVAWQVLAKYGVDKFLGSDAQGNLWAVKQGYLPDESTSLLMASTSQKELVFNVVADFGSQILSVVLRPNKEIMVLAGDKLHKLINNQLAWSKNMEDFRDQYVIEGIPAAEYYDSEEGPPIKYLGTNGQGQIIMLGEGRLGDDNKAIEFLACLSKDNQVEHTTVAPNGGADFTPFDGPYFDVDENEYRIVALPNNPTKLFRQFKTANHQFSFYDITPDCQAINPTTIPLDIDEHLKFTVQPLGNQPEFLFIYSLRLHDSIVQHVAKIGPENKIIWDKVIKVPENQGNKFYTNMDVLVDAAGKKALIVFSNLSRLNESSMIRPLFYEMVLE